MTVSCDTTRKRTRPDLGVLGEGLRAVLQAGKDVSRGNGKKQRVDKEVGGKKDSYDPPDNFSRVNTDLPDAVLQEKFPAYAALKQRGAVVDVVLKAGQMLYIPAGWFHEVRSRSTVNGNFICVFSRKLLRALTLTILSYLRHRH